MNTTTLQAPRIGTRPATAGFWQRLWAALEVQGQRRAAAELRRLAIHHRFSDPEMAQRLRSIASQTETARR